MSRIKIPYDKNVIVGIDTSDDAGVYRLTDELALIQTLDFFTPIVDDPYTFGRIAAANGLSDVYAMGGKPITAMNIVCFPVKKFSLNVLSEILQGGLDILTSAGVQLLGGHSVEDDELKFGISVTGVIRPQKVLRNNGLRDCDSIILTKPLGTGIIGTAIKSGMNDKNIMKACVDSMTALNDKSSGAALLYAVHACTDVTGFGLMGHLKEMCASDQVEVTVDSKKIPLLPGVLENAAMGLIPGGLYRNRDYVGNLCRIGQSVRRELADAVFDPQTSGGLLIALPKTDAEELITDLHKLGITEANIIADVRTAKKQKIMLI